MSTSPRTILATTDFSDSGNRAVHRAARIARSLRARLEVLHVVHGLGSTPWWSESLADDASDGRARRAREQLETLVAHVAREHDVDASGTQRRGAIAECVASRAVETDASLLVVGATGAGAVSGRLLGSSTQAILRAAAIPVLVARTDSQDDYQRVVFAIDFSPASEAAVELGLGFAPGAKCLFLTALDVPAGHVESLLGTDATARAQRLHEAREFARDRLGTLAARNGRDGAGIRVRDGRPGVEIDEAVDEFDADLLCLGAHGKPLLERIMLGSTSAHAVAEARCDVLVVHAQPDAAHA